MFARLPFVTSAAGEGEERARWRSGGWRSSRAATTSPCWRSRRNPASRAAGCGDLLGAAGLEPVWLAAWRGGPEPPQAAHLVEVGSLISEGDERVAEVLNAARGEVLRIVPVGGYPRPLPPA